MSVLGKAEIQFQLIISHQLNKAIIKNFGKIFIFGCVNKMLIWLSVERFGVSVDASV